MASRYNSKAAHKQVYNSYAQENSSRTVHSDALEVMALMLEDLCLALASSGEERNRNTMFALWLRARQRKYRCGVGSSDVVKANVRWRHSEHACT